jgi:hypothetical protein
MLINVFYSSSVVGEKERSNGTVNVGTRDNKVTAQGFLNTPEIRTCVFVMVTVPSPEPRLSLQQELPVLKLGPRAKSLLGTYIRSA